MLQLSFPLQCVTLVMSCVEYTCVGKWLSFKQIQTDLWFKAKVIRYLPSFYYFIQGAIPQFCCRHNITGGSKGCRFCRIVRVFLMLCFRTFLGFFLTPAPSLLDIVHYLKSVFFSSPCVLHVKRVVVLCILGIQKCLQEDKYLSFPLLQSPSSINL